MSIKSIFDNPLRRRSGESLSVFAKRELEEKDIHNLSKQMFTDTLSTSESMKQFASGAVRSRDADHVRFDLISPIGIRRLAETYEEGSRKYSDNNWLKGIPASDLINHVIAHCYKFLYGDKSEDHLAHAAWGLFAIMHFEEEYPAMLDTLYKHKEVKAAREVGRKIAAGLVPDVSSLSFDSESTAPFSPLHPSFIDSAIFPNKTTSRAKSDAQPILSQQTQSSTSQPRPRPRSGSRSGTARSATREGKEARESVASKVWTNKDQTAAREGQGVSSRAKDGRKRTGTVYVPTRKERANIARIVQWFYSLSPEKRIHALAGRSPSVSSSRKGKRKKRQR